MPFCQVEVSNAVGFEPCVLVAELYEENDFLLPVHPCFLSFLYNPRFSTLLFSSFHLLLDWQRNNDIANLQGPPYLWRLAACSYTVIRYYFKFRCLKPHSNSSSASSPSIMSNKVRETKFGKHGGVDPTCQRPSTTDELSMRMADCFFHHNLGDATEDSGGYKCYFQLMKAFEKYLMVGLVYIIDAQTFYFPNIPSLPRRRPNVVNSCTHKLGNFSHGHDFAKLCLNVK